MTYVVTVDSPLASEVTIPDCSREPKIGQRCRVTLGESIIDFGIITAVEVVKDDV